MPDVFNQHRSLLLSIAYRMLGGVADAEDMVQETFLRWQQQDVTEIKSAKAWLISTITRLSIDQMRSARRRREEYVGVWLPEPLVGADEAAASPAKLAALTDSLGLAFMHLLEDLALLERAVFMLREAFDHDYAEIAKIVEKGGSKRGRCSNLKNQEAENQAFSDWGAPIGGGRCFCCPSILVLRNVKKRVLRFVSRIKV